MRQLLLGTAIALACAAVPASADPAISTCDGDDYTVARVEAAGVEVAHVCTNENPLYVTVCVRCLLPTND